MLFVLDDSIGLAMRQGNPAENIIIAVNTMASSYRKGLHLLTAGRNTLHAIIAYTFLDSTSRNIYRHILENLPQMGGYRHLIRRIEITAEKEILTWQNGSSQRVIRLSADYIAWSEISTMTAFLTEDVSEHRFYRKIAQKYLQTNYPSEMITLKYDPRHGGGNRISAQYQEIKEAKERLCLCVVDSDREYSDGPVGPIAQQMQAMEPNELGELLVLAVRMVENLIPLSLLQSTFTNQQKKKVIATLATIRPEQRKYLHLRNGLKLKEFLDANDGFKAFWQEIVGEQPGCRKDSPCTKKESCQCFIVEPLGNLFGDVIAKLDKGVEFTVEDSLKDEWERIGALIVAWCCSSPGIRA